MPALRVMASWYPTERFLRVAVSLPAPRESSRVRPPLVHLVTVSFSRSKLRLSAAWLWARMVISRQRLLVTPTDCEPPPTVMFRSFRAVTPLTFTKSAPVPVMLIRLAPTPVRVISSAPVPTVMEMLPLTVTLSSVTLSLPF